MKFSYQYFFIVIFAITVVDRPAHAQQDLSAQLSKVGSENYKNYLNPVFAGFSADVNSALYHSAKVQGLLGFEISVNHVSVWITDSDKKYDFISPDYIDIRNPYASGTVRLNRNTDYNDFAGAPTMAGDIQDRSVRLSPQSLYYYTYRNSHNGSDVLFSIPRGYSIIAVPLIIPQFVIGLPFGLELIARYLPTMTAMNVGDAGKYNYLGYGIRYDIGQWLPFLPFEAAVHYGTQKMTFKSEDEKDIFTTKGSAYGIEVSRSLSLLTLYCGYQRENASIALHQMIGSYKTPDGMENPFTVPEWTFNGKNASRITLGISVSLLIAHVHAEYSFATTPVIAVGVGIHSASPF